MKHFSHKIISFVMAFVVLFSTMSFTVSMHYCGDTLVETAVFGEAKGCGMEMKNTVTKDCSFTKKSCCNDVQLALDGQDEFKLQLDNISVEEQIFITSFIHSYLNLFEGLNINATNYQDYKPPLVHKQIYKFDETYLI